MLFIDDVHEVLTIGLENAGYVVEYQPDLKKEDFTAKLEEVRPIGVVVRSKLNLDAEYLKVMKQLGVVWIARAGAGVDNIDVEFAESVEIKLFHAVGANADSVAEHMIGMLLTLRHNLYRSHSEVLNFQWNRERNRGTEVFGKTVGIIGYGHTGSKFAEKISGFGVKVLAYDKYNPILTKKMDLEGKENIQLRVTSPETEKSMEDKEFQLLEKYQFEENRFIGNVEGVELDELLKRSDIISFHVPLTDETRNWVNDDFLIKCKRGLVLLNGSRGEVVELHSVLRYLEQGFLGGFAADVLEVEPPSKMNDHTREVFEKLGKLSNVMFSPHIAGWSIESYRQISEYLLRKILNSN